jgi:hypothetical protein
MRLCQVKGQVRTINSYQVRLSQITSGYVRLVQIMSGYVRLFQVVTLGRLR